MIYMLQPSIAVSTWRTRWPGEELRRRGHDVAIDSLDVPYRPDEIPRADVTVLHLTPSLWAHEPWRRRAEQAIAQADRLVIDLDDDWTRILEL